MAEGQVEGIYETLKQMAVGYQLRPGDRLNEVVLSRQLGVSRTPLREALNRLVTENMFDFRPGAGFFCRPLEAKTVFDLYEMRRIIEVAAARLACERASDDELGELRGELLESGIDITGLTVAEACDRDEAFHTGIARLSGNAVLLAQLERINERIRYIRWVSLTLGQLRKSKGEHVALAEALVARDAVTAERIVTTHITKRIEDVIEVVKQGISNIYMDMGDDISKRIIEEAQT